MESRADSMRESRAPWMPLMSASTNAVALADPAFSLTKPSTHVLPTGNFRLVRLVFAGTRTAADNETFDYQVIGWQQYKRPATHKGFFWLPRILAEGTVRLGTKQVGAPGADIEGSTTYLADFVNDSKNLSGTNPHAPADDTMGFLELDTANCDLIQVETVLGTVATMDVIYQLSDGVW